jgi:cobalt-zinc-cadmium efflux system outer membrane protein
MFRPKFKALLIVVATAWLVGIPSAWAQAPAEAKQSTADITRNQSKQLSLKEAFELAWSRQPEARSQTARQEAVSAARAAASSWTIEPPALALQGKSDRMGSNNGSREYEVGLAVPLWLPGERSRSGELADAEAKALDSRFLAAKLRVTEVVRERWWNYYRAEGELTLAKERQANALRLADDVARRFKAGDLSKADMHQANGQAALADASLAEAQGNRDVALNALRSLIGTLPSPDAQAINLEPMPDSKALNEPANHPALLELLDRASVAWRAAELANVRTRANPEILIATTKSRAQTGADSEQIYTFGIRIPFGAGPRAEARRATARAEALDAESSAELERSRIVASIESAQAQVLAAQSRLTAAEKRARYARESQGFFEKSFRLGESDLPTRLRIELEATEAERQLSKARIDVAAAISSLRQSLGLLPE